MVNVSGEPGPEYPSKPERVVGLPPPGCRKPPSKPGVSLSTRVRARQRALSGSGLPDDISSSSRSRLLLRSASADRGLTGMQKRAGYYCKTSMRDTFWAQMAKLDVVLGRSVLGPVGLAVSESTSSYAFLAGCTVVVRSLDGSVREGHLVGSHKHVLTCLDFSPCGRFIVTGESGHKPCVRVFEVEDVDGRWVGKEFCALSDHQISVAVVRFACEKRVISVGCNHDSQVFIWNWRQGQCMASAKVSADILNMAVSPDATQFVTVGNKHVKFWSIPVEVKGRIASRSVVLAEHRSSQFIDVVFFDNDRMFVVTVDHVILLLSLQLKRFERTYEWPGLRPCCLTKMGASVVIGCRDGEVRILSGTQLHSADELPLPAYLGMDVAEASSVFTLDRENQPPDVTYPTVRAVSATENRIVCVYADHSSFVFEKSTRRWTKLFGATGHVGQINVIKSYPSHLSHFPFGTFATGGADGTVRLWNLNQTVLEDDRLPDKNVLRILFLESDSRSLVETRAGVRPMSDSDCLERAGIQTIEFSPNGEHMAAGSSNGRIHVVNVSEQSFDSVGETIDAHEQNINCLTYSPHEYPGLFVSGGRDSLVHAFRVGSDAYEHVETFQDHHCSVTATTFVSINGGGLKLLTTSKDGIIVIRSVLFSEREVSFERLNIITVNSLMNVARMPQGNAILVACSDRQLRTYDAKGKCTSTVKGTGGELEVESGTLYKSVVDSSGQLAVCISSSRLVYLMEIATGQCLAVFSGTGNLVLDAEFSADSKHVFVTSSNGCVMAWRLSKRIKDRMKPGRISMENSSTQRSESKENSSNDGGENSSDAGNTNSNTTFVVETGLPDATEEQQEIDNSTDGELLTEDAQQVVELSVRPHSELSPVIVEAAPVSRRSHSHLPSQLDIPSHVLQSPAAGDILDDSYESQSDFVSRRREPERYQTSKSMVNLRESSDGLTALQALKSRMAETPRRSRGMWDNNQNVNFSSSYGGNSQMTTSLYVPQQQNANLAAVSARYGSDDQWSGDSERSAQQQLLNSSSLYTRGNTDMPPSPARHNGLLQSPSQTALSNLRARHDAGAPPVASARRESLEQGKRQTDDKLSHQTPTRPTWSATALTQRRQSNMNGGSSPSSALVSRRQSDVHGRTRIRDAVETDAFRPKRQPLTAKTKAAVEEPRVRGATRRAKTVVVTSRDASAAADLFGRTAALSKKAAEDYTGSSLYLRSRSQSPNQLALRHQGIPASRDLSRDLQRRRDSDMSYTAVNSRMTPASSRSNLRDGELRKSTDALNKMYAIRSKLHQSTENLRKSSDTLAFETTSNLAERPGKTRSISNLRGGGGQLETFGSFDVDSQTRPQGSSLAHSRMLARSMGNVSQSGEQGEQNQGQRIRDTMERLRKASNPDLTAQDQYEDSGSPLTEKKRRGAVQKKVERYHPRRSAAARQPTSEESDASDASPLNQSSHGLLRTFGTNHRSISSVETRGSSGFGRRLYEKQGMNGLPSVTRRTTNYLSQKMGSDDYATGPDLGSDESPRSSLNASEWQALLDGPSDSQQLLLHVQECCDQMLIHLDKLLMARKLVAESSSLTSEQKKVVGAQIDRISEKASVKIHNNNNSGRSSAEEKLNGNDYVPASLGPQIHQVMKTSLAFRH